jgi:DNA-directed RNA polymerase subunit RPC12/RpoP
MPDHVNAPQPTIGDLIAAIADARQVIREMHGATKDLRQLIVQARQIPGEVSSELAKRIEQIAGDIHRDLEEHAAALALRLTEGLPVNILCARCGAILAAIAEPDVPLICGSCGHKFMIRKDVS